MAPQPGAEGWLGALSLGDTVSRAEALGIPVDDEVFQRLGDAFAAPSAARRDLGLVLIAIGDD